LKNAGILYAQDLPPEPTSSLEANAAYYILLGLPFFDESDLRLHQEQSALISSATGVSHSLTVACHYETTSGFDLA